MGLPHSSQNTSRTFDTCNLPLHCLDVLLHRANHAFTGFIGINCSCDGRDVGVDLSKSFRRQPQEANPGLKDLGHRFFLVGNGGDHEIRLGCQNLRCIRRPRVSQNRRRMTRHGRHNVTAVTRASHHTI